MGGGRGGVITVSYMPGKNVPDTNIAIPLSLIYLFEISTHYYKKIC